MSDRAEQVSREVVRLLCELRKKQGISHLTPANMTGLSRSYIGMLESGQRRPTLEVAIKLAWALDMRLSKLLLKAERLAGHN